MREVVTGLSHDWWRLSRTEIVEGFLDAVGGLAGR